MARSPDARGTRSSNEEAFKRLDHLFEALRDMPPEIMAAWIEHRASQLRRQQDVVAADDARLRKLAAVLRGEPAHDIHPRTPSGRLTRQASRELRRVAGATIYKH